ncbi:MAG: PA0069 family radical SAM protein [Verrucomicrobia bacterium]|nr:PA0069 family radical SAM protein [Verrucomicrobiota bacterium]
MRPAIPITGRGSASNPANRFERLHLEFDADTSDPSPPGPRTLFFKDASTTILSENNSPDLGFRFSINPYRGCEHGCAYCYARPTHEYLGLSAGLDFESRIMVKERAPELLRDALSSPKWIPQVIAMSGVTDCYQPVERRLRLTRRCLEVLAEFRNPVGIVTKNHWVTQDIDVLRDLARWNAVIVYVSVTTLDAGLASKLEPRTSMPDHRLEAIRTLSSSGVPVGVLVAPVIPGLTDHEIPAILSAAAAAGAREAGYTMLRLPHAVVDLFQEWLRLHRPLQFEKVLSRLRAVRNGALSSSEFGERMEGQGEFAKQIAGLFEVTCRRHGLGVGRHQLSAASFRRPGGVQLSLGV